MVALRFSMGDGQSVVERMAVCVLDAIAGRESIVCSRPNAGPRA
jgi:hypothetical protein